MYFDAIRYEFMFDTDIWTDVSDYVIGTDMGQMGIRGWGPLDRVAGTGSFTFSLRNIDNMFTPGHINCLDGFETGVKFKLVLVLDGDNRTRFYGTIPADGIQVDTSDWHSVTTVTVVDYMEQLAIHELDLPEFAENKRIDEIVPLIIANMPIAPLSTDYNTGQDTFATVFDTAKVRTRAMQEISKVAVSELGYVYVKQGDALTTLNVMNAEYEPINGIYYMTDIDVYTNFSYLSSTITLERALDGLWQFWEDGGVSHYYSDNYDAVTPVEVTGWSAAGGIYEVMPIVEWTFEDEILVVEGRQTRVGDDFIDAGAPFDDCFADHALAHAKHYYNAVKVRAYPRRVDSAATTVLFTLEKPIAVAAGATETIKGSFRDPDQEAVSVAGIAMVTPVATTDYQLNAAEDGSGTDLTANLSVTATYGVNGVEYELENTGATLGYVIHLQARGKGVYTYHPVEYEDEYAAGISADGKHTLNLNLAYQDNPLVAKDFAGVFLDQYARKRLVVDSVTMIANTSSTLLDAFFRRQIGDKIQILIGSATVDGAYHIHSIDFTINPHGIVNFTFGLFPASLAPSESYWMIGDAGYSEIGETTVMGF